MAKKCTPISLSEEQTGLHKCECKRPAKTDPTYRQWVRCDDIVTSWILHSLGREVAVSVEYVGDALELWTELEDRYDQTNEAKLYQTQKEINDLSQGKGMAANSVSLSCDASGGQVDNSDSQFDASGNNNINLTKEQYGQFTHLLRQFQSCSTMEDQNDMQMTCACGAVNFADSGASHNMTFDKDHLVNMIALPYPLLVRLPNGYRVKAPLMKRPLEIGKTHDQFQF
ncbi:hypothetical protein KY284_032656 [Solanum tuberosum]|nr:hypothetical protein KY284_032656 [Solanum tuberosum]